MQRKRPLDTSGMTPAAAPGGGVPLNGTATRTPKQTNYYDDPSVYDKDFSDHPPASKRPGPTEEYYYNDYPTGGEYPPTGHPDSWARGYERETHPSQFSGSQVMAPPADYDYYAHVGAAEPQIPKQSLITPKRKLTCELPMPVLPERTPNSRFGLGLDRYGHETPGILTDEFQEIVKEMQGEIAFLKRHPEVSSRIPHAVRILEKECYKLDKCVDPEWLEVDINKPINIVRKIIIPVNRYPTFNFIGKIIGNRGTTLHNLGKAFKCHINLYGEGSSRDRKKESHYFASGNVQHLHYGLPMFIQISTIARPHIAFMRVAGFLNVLHKMLIPSHDVHIAGITDGNTWFESTQTFVYEPLVFDEAADEEKEAELRTSAALRKPVRGETGSYRGASTRGMSSRGAPTRGAPTRGRGGLLRRAPDPVQDYVAEYEPNQYEATNDEHPTTTTDAVSSPNDSQNGTESASVRGGASARGASRGRGRGRGAVPIRRS